MPFNITVNTNLLISMTKGSINNIFHVCLLLYFMCVYYIYFLCLLYIFRVSIIYMSCVYCIYFACLLYIFRVSIVYISCVYCIYFACLLYIFRVSITYISCVYYIYFVCLLYIFRVCIIYISLQPHTLLQSEHLPLLWTMSRLRLSHLTPTPRSHNPRTRPSLSHTHPPTTPSPRGHIPLRHTLHMCSKHKPTMSW